MVPFVDDWPALVTKFFDATKGAQVRELILNDQLHEHDSEGEIYSSDCPPKFNLKIASESAKAKVAQAFRADEVCLGYADGPRKLRRGGRDGNRCRQPYRAYIEHAVETSTTSGGNRSTYHGRRVRVCATFPIVPWFARVVPPPASRSPLGHIHIYIP